MNERGLNRFLNALLFMGVIGFGSFIVSLSFIFPPEEDGYLGKNLIVVGYNLNPTTIDPIDTWYFSDKVIEHQVVEGLVDYNYSDHPNYRIIPKLAVDWFWHGPDKISFKLREGIYFHDGEIFDADAVIWNLDRLTWFCNYTGELHTNLTSWLAFPSSVLYFSDGVTPIIKNYYKNSKYNLTIELSNSFTPFLDLLTFTAFSILSPKSTPRYKYIDLRNGDLVGTGPFIFDFFEPDFEIRYHRNEIYWGKFPWANVLIFDINEDDLARNIDMVALKIDYLQQPLADRLNTFNASPYYTLNCFNDFSYYYLEFYSGPPFNFSAGKPEPILKNGKINQKLNSTLRRALSLAINYTYILEEIPLASAGFYAILRSMSGYNSSLEGKMVHNFPFNGTYQGNVKKARECMQSMGFGIGWDTNFPGSNETEWKSATFRILEVNQHSGSITNQKINQLLEKCWNLIGIETNVTIRYVLSEASPWEIDVAFGGWFPDYLDGFNILETLFNNDSIYCWTQISDPVLKNALENAAETIDANTRQNIYKWIQSYIFDITRIENPSSYCIIPGFTKKWYSVHRPNLKGIGYNDMGMLDCWNWFIE